MDLAKLVARAAHAGASDVHLEPGAPITWRVGGELDSKGEPLEAPDTEALARQVLGEDAWRAFVERGSADLARTLAGVRCRLAVLRSRHGVGLCVRLLPDVQPTLSSLNLHPDLSLLVHDPHGLVLVAGPTGSGKSSTLAALLAEVNRTRQCHVVTIEQPIEYGFRNDRAFFRQREVGRDTPSFDQALVDALREDPDVIMVGEMRRPSTMQLVLDAAETGHLVLTTVHSGRAAEALQRIVNAMPPESQAHAGAQLADALRAVISQRLVHHPEMGFRVPELEILRGTTASRALIRQGHFHKLGLVMETGAKDGHWSLERYRKWLAGAHLPSPAGGDAARLLNHAPPDVVFEDEPPRLHATAHSAADETVPPEERADDVVVVEPPGESLSDILAELDEQERPGR